MNALKQAPREAQSAALWMGQRRAWRPGHPWGNMTTVWGREGESLTLQEQERQREGAGFKSPSGSRSYWVWWLLRHDTEKALLLGWPLGRWGRTLSLFGLLLQKYHTPGDLEIADFLWFGYLEVQDRGTGRSKVWGKPFVVDNHLVIESSCGGRRKGDL